MPELRRLQSALTVALAVTAPCLGFAQAFPDARPIPMLSPEDSMATMRFAEPGYRLELVAAEPLVEEPVLIEWDAQGRLYVAEMLTYMQDIDGSNELTPRSRVSRLEDRDGDGRMDHRTVFVDELLLPRMILALDDRILIRETNTLDLYSYRDTDDDGIADEKTLIYDGGKRGGNLEHQPSGLVWNLDNWIYTTYSAHRFRFTRGKMEVEPLPHGSGQWGIAKDDLGKLYYSTAGGEMPAMDFQQPIIYGKIRFPGELAPGFRVCWPIDDIPDTQGGRGRLRKDNTLNWFTGVAGQSIYRGDQLPQDFYGDLIIPEPVGRLVRRAKVENQAGKTVLSNAYHEEEFIASTDPNFRPVNSATGPDGCLYLVDMYRGIIQEGAWVSEGSYLRPVVAAYGLDKNIGRGRIYRIVHENYGRGEAPDLLHASNETLIAALQHPNGWQRDTAQKQLILRRDPATIPLLRKLLTDAPDPRTRLHALWTLEGLDAIQDSGLLRTAMQDPAWSVRAAAIRNTEPLLIKKDITLLPDILALAKQAEPNVAIQAMLSIQHSGLAKGRELVDQIVAAHPTNEAIGHILATYEETEQKRLQAIARQEALQRENARKAAAIKRGEAHYRTLCFACHGDDGTGTKIPGSDQTMAPSLVGSPRVSGTKEALARILLQGLTGPIDGKNYTALMVPMASYDDPWLADLMTFLRNSWGNRASVIEADDVTAIRAATQDRQTPWTLAELSIYNPKEWTLSASHGKNALRAALDGNPKTRYSTNQPQKPGMWFQVDFPHPIQVRKLILDTRGSNSDWPKQYSVQVSKDGKQWGDPVATGYGDHPLTEIRIDPVVIKAARITQTGRKEGLFWSIHEFSVE